MIKKYRYLNYMGMMLLQTVLILLLFSFFIFFVAQSYHIIFLGFAPFLSTKNEVLKKIINSLDIKDDTVVYELGCGRADFLHLIRKEHPKTELIGIEYSYIPYLIAQIRSSILGRDLKTINQDISKTDITKADIIYCYLNVGTMKGLEEKFKKECKQGAQVISYQFPLPNKQPEKVVKINQNKSIIYFYKY